MVQIMIRFGWIRFVNLMRIRSEDEVVNVVSLCVTDIDECSQLPEICTFGTCSNTEGSFTCLCPEGFQISASGRRCLGNCVCVGVCDRKGWGIMKSYASSLKCNV